MNRVLTGLTAVLVLSGCSSSKPARKPTTKPANAGATTSYATPAATQPATVPVKLPDPDPAALKILQNLEAADKKYAGIRADIRHEVVNRTLGDSEIRTGYVVYQRQRDQTPAMFRMHFDTLQHGQGRKIADVVDYAFDGRWLTVMKHRVKQITRFEVVRAGEKAQPLKLGQGPFPVPFGQEAAEVIKIFHATTRPVRDGEPKDTDYLKLVPHGPHRKKVSITRLEMWVDRKRHLPARIAFRDHARNETTVTFSNIQTPTQPFEKSMFTLGRKAGWSYTEKPLE